MVDAPISHVWIRDLARRGRFRPPRGGLASARPQSARRAYASRPESGAEATAFATTLPSRPRGASSRPGEGDLVTSTIP